MNIQIFVDIKDCVFSGLRADVNVVLPIRQTASIFKQPVTIVSNHPDSKTRSDLRHGSQEQPRQVKTNQTTHLCVKTFLMAPWLDVLTICRPLLAYGYSYKASCARLC